MASLEERVDKLEKRNKRVELDKDWEVSWTRRVVILLLTYVILGLYLWIIKVNDAWLNAIVPSIGFVLSTASLPWFRRLWEDNKKA